MSNFPSPVKGNGGGLSAIPNRFKFDDTAAREAYFNGHKKDLVKLQTLILVGDKAMIWTGSTNPSVYTPSRWSGFSTTLKGDKGDTGASGAGVDLTGLNKNEIPVYDPVTNKLVNSGVQASLGELTVAPGTIKFGNHRMSSSNENVVFSNSDTGKNYTPVWQVQEVGSKDAYMRIIADTVEEVVRVPLGNVDVTNPINLAVTIDRDETFFGGKFTLSQPATDVIMEAYDQKGLAIWEEQLGDLSAGEHEVTFDIPLDVRKGFQYDLHLSARGGNKTVVAKSNASTGFSWTAKRATWTDARVVKESDLDKLVSDVEVQSGRLVVTDKDGTVKQMALPTGSGSGITVDSNVRNGELVKWNSGTQSLDGTEIYDNTSEVAMPPSGITMGTVKVIADPMGVTINPYFMPNVFKPIVQPVLENSKSFYSRDYGAEEGADVVTDDTTSLVNPSTKFTPQKSAVISKLYIKPASPIQQLIIKVEENGFEVWRATRNNIPAGLQELDLIEKPDFKVGVEYTFKFSGYSSDGSAQVHLRGGTEAMSSFKVIPYVTKEIATQEFVSNTLSGFTGKITTATSAANKATQDVTTLNSKVSGINLKVTELEKKVGAGQPGGGGDQPTKYTPEFWAEFSDSLPTNLNTATKASGNRVTITRTRPGAARVMITLPSAGANHVVGIKEDGGIASLWPKRDVTINGESFAVFYSLRAYNELTATFVVDFTQGNLYV